MKFAHRKTAGFGSNAVVWTQLWVGRNIEIGSKFTWPIARSLFHFCASLRSGSGTSKQLLVRSKWCARGARRKSLCPHGCMLKNCLFLGNIALLLLLCWRFVGMTLIYRLAETKSVICLPWHTLGTLLCPPQARRWLNWHVLRTTLVTVENLVNSQNYNFPKALERTV